MCKDFARLSQDTFAHTTQDAIVFAKNGAELVAGEAGIWIRGLRLAFSGKLLDAQAGSTLQIRNIQNFSYWPNPGSGNVSMALREGKGAVQEIVLIA